MEISQCFRGHNLLTNEFLHKWFSKTFTTSWNYCGITFHVEIILIYCKYANYKRKLRGSYYKNKVSIPPKMWTTFNNSKFPQLSKSFHTMSMCSRPFFHVCQQGYKLFSTIIKIWWLELFTMIRVFKPLS